MFTSDQRYLILDYETRSRVDLKRVGGWEYSVHPSTQVLCVAWRLGTKAELPNVKTKVWSPGIPSPYGELVKSLCDPYIICVAHNAFFEQVITKNTLSRIINRPELKTMPPDRWLCTATLAAALALPRSLEGASRVLGLTHQKDMDGHRLMLKMCKPRKATKTRAEGWHNKKSDLLRLMEYCARDVDAETEIFLTCPPLSDYERKTWILDQQINLRGFCVDRDLVNTALKLSVEEVARFDKDAQRITDGAVQTIGQRDAILDWLEAHDCHMPDLRANTVREYLNNNLADGAARELLEIRNDAAKTSTKKFKAFEERSRSDGRVRDHLLYWGASTGRFAGRGVQIQNLPRPSVPDTNTAAEIIKAGNIETIRQIYGNPLDAMSSCLRSAIVPPPMHLFFCGDYSAIEARVLFWLAGHEKGLKAYRDGEDIYRIMASVIYNIPVEEVTKAQRDLGKRAILGCLAAGTPINTPTGVKPIESVTTEDKVWDGRNWVEHGGLVPQGLKDVIRIEKLNIELTPDHWVLSPNGWQTAVEIASSEDTQRLLLGPRMEGVPLFPPNFTEALNAVFVSAAYAELKKNYELIRLHAERAYCALSAQTLSMDKEGETRTEIVTSYLIQNLERVGEYVSTISGRDAITLMTKTSRGMAVAALSAPSKTSEHFWNTLLRCAGLINGGCRWTELITIGVMNPETYESLRKGLTTRTAETYDIVDAGPNRCFNAGRAIVHNCGYGMGQDKFRDTCRQQGGLIIDEDLAKRAVYSYRSLHAPVPQLWKAIERAALYAVLHPGKRVKTHKTKWWVSPIGKIPFLWCEIPSGRRIAYAEPEVHYDKTLYGKRPRLTYMGVNQKVKGMKWARQSNWGGGLVENVDQAIARDLLVHSLHKCEAAGYETSLHAHDEILGSHVVGKGSVEEFEKLMGELPPWAEGLPMKVEVWKGTRYRK